MASFCRRAFVKCTGILRVRDCQIPLNTHRTFRQNNILNGDNTVTFSHCFRHFCAAKPMTQKDKVTIHFLVKGGERKTTDAKVGDNLLDVIVENDVDIDGFGACEGTLACSTCHLIFKDEDYKKIPEQPTDEEFDMLDLAYGLQDTSRLGCQVIVTKDMEGMEVSVPAGIADARDV